MIAHRLSSIAAADEVIQVGGMKMQHDSLESKRIFLVQIPGYGLLDGKSQWYTIIEKRNHVNIGFIGMVHCHPEWNNTGIQIFISKEENRRKGYALEALELLEQYIFDVILYQRISVRIIDFDKSSIGFFKKAGFKLEGVEEQGYYCCGKYYDLILLRLLRQEYVQRTKNLYGS